MCLAIPGQMDPVKVLQLAGQLGPLPRKFELAAPVLGAFSLAFGLWYGLQALPYAF